MRADIVTGAVTRLWQGRVSADDFLASYLTELASAFLIQIAGERDKYHAYCSDSISLQRGSCKATAAEIQSICGISPGSLIQNQVVGALGRFMKDSGPLWADGSNPKVKVADDTRSGSVCDQKRVCRY